MLLHLLPLLHLCLQHTSQVELFWDFQKFGGIVRDFMNIQFHGFLFLFTKSVTLETSSQVILKPLFSKSCSINYRFFTYNPASIAPPPAPASSKWQARALTFHHRPPILFQYYRRLRHFSEFCEIFRGERGDFERIFGKIPETLRQFFTMFIAKPILQKYALAAIFASQKSYVCERLQK